MGLRALKITVTTLWSPRIASIPVNPTGPAGASQAEAGWVPGLVPSRLAHHLRLHLHPTCSGGASSASGFALSQVSALLTVMEADNS